ncbi:hypothetical protein D3C84_920940 [compost metagenome]
MFNLFGNHPQAEANPQTEIQERAVQTVETLTKDMSPMITALLNPYLGQLWANMDDERILHMCAEVKNIIAYIETGETPHVEQDSD